MTLSTSVNGRLQLQNTETRLKGEGKNPRASMILCQVCFKGAEKSSRLRYIIPSSLISPTNVQFFHAKVTKFLWSANFASPTRLLCTVDER